MPGSGGTVRALMPRRDQGEPTRYPGVAKVPGGYRIRVKIKDPRTGKSRQGERVMDGASLKEAIAARVLLLEDLRTSAGSEGLSSHPTLDDFAAFWSRSKRGTVDTNTLDRYVDILDLHVLPVLGAFHVDAIRAIDLQSLVNQWKETDVSRHTVRGWWRVLRMVLRDAVAQLQLGMDPTLRIQVPAAPEGGGSSAIDAGKLALFLDAMRDRFPGDFVLCSALAFTGLRFCHVGGWKWDDIDEGRGVVQIQRRVYNGQSGPVSRRKRAPKETALHPYLIGLLKTHRARLVARQAKGLEHGWVFPSRAGGTRRPDSLAHAWRLCTKAAGIVGRFSPHGLRKTFHDLARVARVDAVVTMSMVGHVTDREHERYSTVGMDEKREAVAGVLRLVRPKEGKR